MPKRLVLLFASLLAVTGCGVSGVMTSGGTTIPFMNPAPAAPAIRSLLVDVLPVVETATATDDLEAGWHHWVRRDVSRLDVVLSARMLPGLASASDEVVHLNAETTPPDTRALFTDLVPGGTYSVQVVARGDVEGWTPNFVLNAAVPTAKRFTVDPATSSPRILVQTLTVTLDATATLPASGSWQL